MSLTHCPLCLALAVMSLVRGLGHALLVWQLRPLPVGPQPLLRAA